MDPFSGIDDYLWNCIWRKLLSESRTRGHEPHFRTTCCYDLGGIRLISAKDILFRSSWKGLEHTPWHGSSCGCSVDRIVKLSQSIHRMQMIDSPSHLCIPWANSHYPQEVQSPLRKALTKTAPNPRPCLCYRHRISTNPTQFCCVLPTKPNPSLEAIFDAAKVNLDSTMLSVLSDK